MSASEWIDIFLVAGIALSALLAPARGCVQVFADLLGSLFSLALAVLLTPELNELLSRHTVLSPPWSALMAFTGLWLTGLALARLTREVLLAHLIARAARSMLNCGLALIPGALRGLLAGVLVLATLASLPLPATARDEINAASLAGPLVKAALELEQPLQEALGPALSQLTFQVAARPHPAKDDAGWLGFAVRSPGPALEEEERMLAQVNVERLRLGLPPLMMDETLRRLARSYAGELFGSGYFSHTGLDGRSPFDRMRDAGVLFSTAGENLALAPDGEVAHEALMGSVSHRANILNRGFHRVGIGVLDGGVHGFLFVQEYSD